MRNGLFPMGIMKKDDLCLFINRFQREVTITKKYVAACRPALSVLINVEFYDRMSKSDGKRPRAASQMKEVRCFIESSFKKNMSGTDIAIQLQPDNCLFFTSIYPQ